MRGRAGKEGKSERPESGTEFRAANNKEDVQEFGLFASDLPQLLSSPANLLALNGLNIGQDSKIIFARETSFTPACSMGNYWGLLRSPQSTLLNVEH